MAAGIAMLKLSGFHRVMAILSAGLVAGIVRLYLPLLVAKVIEVGVFAAVLVLLLWLAHWLFAKIPQFHAGLVALRGAALLRLSRARKDKPPKQKEPKESYTTGRKKQPKPKKDQE